MTGTAVAIAAGSLQNVFSHGVMSALERGGLSADCYAGVSSATLPAALAAAGQAEQVGVEHWLRAAQAITEFGLADAVAGSVDRYAQPVQRVVFSRGAPRLLIGTSQVTTPRAIRAVTTRPGAIGAGLLVGDPHRSTAWARRHLAPVVWDSAGATGGHRALTARNLAEVAEASTRMLVDGEGPVTFGAEVHIDGCYTHAVPLRAVTACGYRRVIVISPYRRPFHDLYRTQPVVPTSGNDARTVVRVPLDAVGLSLHVTTGGTEVHTLTPPASLRTLGVELHAAGPDALRSAYQTGLAAGGAYLAYLGQRRTLLAALTRRAD